jgi:Protein of unknown function (DUF4012)
MTEQSEGSGSRRRQKSSAAALSSPRNIVWLGLTIISVTIFVAAARVSISVRDIQSRIAVVERFTQGDASPDLPLLRDNIAAIRSDLVVIRTDVGWLFPVIPLLSWLPQVGADVAAAGDLFNMADALVRAGDTMLSGVTAIAGGSLSGTPAATDDLVRALGDARPQVELARGYLSTASFYRARITPSLLSARSLALVDRFDAIMPLAELAATAGLALPDLVGSNGSRTYLIVAQNEDERRATGGFVSAAGLATFEHGALTSLDFMDSYQVEDPTFDYPQPPAPLEKYMLAGYWLFRDANWSPDFPTSARQLAAFYEMSKGKHVDGVIALDQAMVRMLVQAIGPFDVPGNPPSHVTADNVLGFMREAWAPPAGVPLTAAIGARKDFVGKMAKAMQSRFQDGPRPNVAALARAIYDSLRGRHLLLYLPDSPLANPLELIGWDGAIHPSTGDYLMVVDSNLGFNKADALVNRQFSYDVTVDSNLSVHSTLSIQYHNDSSRASQVCTQRVPDYGPDTTYESLMNQCYWDYLRLLVPSGSTLFDSTRYPIPAARMLNRKDSSGDPEILAAENIRSAFATFFMLDRGEDKNLRFTYDPPHGLVEQAGGGLWIYRLYWQKQPGAAETGTQVSLTLPRGSSLVREMAPVSAAVTGDESADGLRLSFAWNLDSDAAIEVQFHRN